MLNKLKEKSNMYNWVNFTWNPIKGECNHNCNYCYCKRFPQGELRLDEKCFKDNLGKDNFIFIGSSTDMFADNVNKEWIEKVLYYCKKEYPYNKYLFQTKNPKRFNEFYDKFSKDTILGITLESNRDYNISKAPLPQLRFFDFHINTRDSFKKFVSIEPILDFDLEILVKWIKLINPEFVSIGADSKGHKLIEPSKEKILKLIEECKKFTQVKLKDNLKRLLL